jgi:putative effector of murein hydrolase LrgA (UPF0299 family)
MKRTIATVLWFYAFWYLGALIAAFLGISELFGPILGIAAGALIAIDPRRIIWLSQSQAGAVARSTSGSSPSPVA